jgi:DNA (cytosine-5)-methyltransferase 1
VNISGLDRYIPKFRSLSVIASIENLSEYFNIWNLIENALVSRSKFFSLIDIYGHYANKGDAVNIDGNWQFNAFSPEVRILNFFGNTQKCGSIVKESVIFEATGLDEKSFKVAVTNLRKFRLDIRTSATHPILGAKRVLCTYPFPLLSPRALVESRVQLLPDAAMHDESVLMTA